MSCSARNIRSNANHFSCSSRPNHEKILYAKLLRFREEQLEHYEGPPMDYSISDYHHNPPPPQATARRSSTRVSLQARRSNHRQSQYSLLDPNAPPPRKSVSQSVHRRSSIAETEKSYDPYRPSKAQIAKTQADHMRVTVLRGTSQQSGRKPSIRISSKVSLRNPSLSNVQGGDDDYSIASSPQATRMHSAGTSQLQRLTVNSRISRGNSRNTLASRCSAASGSSAVVARKSTSYKRNIIFAHNRKVSDHHPRLRSKEHHPPALTLQERFLQDQNTARTREESDQTEERQSPNFVAQRSQLSQRESPEPEELTIIRSRKAAVQGSGEHTTKKARPGSHHFRDEARKVSTEIEKLCDEAFNRLPLSSSVTTPATTATGNRNSANTYQTYQSSTTSFSVHEDLVPVRVTRQNKPREVGPSYQERPLPKPPATERRMDSEHLGSYTQRELAKTRDLLKKRAAESDMSPGYLDEVIAHLDRLMQPSAIRTSEAERRAISTPDPNSSIPRHDTFERILEKNNIGFRSASAPTKKHKSTRSQTIRLVDSPSDLHPISPVKPLTIRKKSESSTPSAGSPRQITPKERLVTTEDLYRQQAGERRSTGIACLENPSLDPIEEDTDKENFDPADRSQRDFVGEPKKRNWFRRRNQPITLPSHPTRSKDAPRDCDLDQYENTHKRKSDVPSEDSQASDQIKTGKGRFFKIFSGKRANKESRTNTGDYDLDDNISMVTEDSSRMYNPTQAYMSGALPNTSLASVPNRSSKGSRNDKLMPPPQIPRAIQPHQNWLARFLRIKPAVAVMGFQVSKVKARKEVAIVLREWRKYGMRDIVVDKVAARVWARVDVKNCALLSFDCCPLS